MRRPAPLSRFPPQDREQCAHKGALVLIFADRSTLTIEQGPERKREVRKEEQMVAVERERGMSPKTDGIKTMAPVEGSNYLPELAVRIRAEHEATALALRRSARPSSRETIGLWRRRRRHRA